MVFEEYVRNSGERDRVTELEARGAGAFQFGGFAGYDAVRERNLLPWQVRGWGGSGFSDFRHRELYCF